MKRFYSLRSFPRFVQLNSLALCLVFGASLAQEPEQSPRERSLPKAASSAEASERRIQSNAHFAAGIGFEAKGQIEEAAKELLLAVDVDPNNAALALRVAEKLLEWRLPSISLQILEKASQTDSATVEIFVRKGITLKALGKNDEALAAFTAALEISPGNAEARKELVATRLKEKDLPGALSLVRDGVALPSLSSDQLIGLVTLYLQIITDTPSLLAELKDELLVLLERTEKFSLSEPTQQVTLADGFIFVGVPEKAKLLLQSVVKTAPETALAREKLVDLYLREGQTEKAVDELNKLLEQNPRNPSAHYLLGSIAADAEDYEQAIQHYEKAIEARPEFEPPYYEMVGIHLNTRQPRKALRLLSQARSRFPKRFLGEFYTGIALASLRRTDEALKYLLEAESIGAQQSPQRLSSFFYFQLGSMLERNGQYSKAEEKFLKCLETNPDDPETLNYLGYMWAEQGKKLKQASVWITKALELAPESAAIQDSMGWLLYQQGDYKKALPYLLNAEAGLDEPDPVILDHLGDAYHALGKKPKAIESWKASLELEFNERVFEKIRATSGTDSDPN